jgi:hypothetical protein
MVNPIIDFPKNAEFARAKILPLFQGMRVDDALTILDAAEEALLHYTRVDIPPKEKADPAANQSPE